MFINLYSKKFFKILSLPIFLYFCFFDIISFNKEIKADKKLLAATDQDLFLYKGMGASYLCIASKAGIEFPKALGVATATYVQVVEGKHGGVVKELGNKKLEREKLFAGAEFQIVTTAINLAIGNKSFFINEDESWLSRQNNSDRNRSNRNGNNRMRNTNKKNNYQNDSFETYKFNFGKIDRVRVANIISSICTSTNINGRSIGKIQIFNEYSLVDLPRDLHGEVRNKLKNLRIRN